MMATDEKAQQKLCPKCKEWKPATLEYFHAHKTNLDGLRTPCKQCRSRAKQSNVQPGFKRCAKCKQELPATTEYFHAHTSKKDGLRSECKTCRAGSGAAYMKAWRQANAEKVQQYTKKYDESGRRLQKDRHYRETRKELLRERRKQYYHANPERERERTKRYRLSHPEKIRQMHQKRSGTERYREQLRRYAQKNRERRRIIQQRRIARKLAASGSHTLQDIRRQFEAQRGRCYYCSKDLDTYQVDHVIPLSRGGSDDPSNLVVTCPPCNRKKHNKLPHEWPEGGKLF